MRQLVRFKWGMRGKDVRKESCYIEPIEIASSLTSKHCGDCTSDCSNGVLVYNQPCKILKPYGSTGGIAGIKLKVNIKDIASPITARDYKGILRNDGDAIVEVRDAHNVAVIDDQGRANKKLTLNDICPTLRAQSHGNEPKVIGGVGEKTFGKQYPQGNRIYDVEHISPALQAKSGNASKGSVLIGGVGLPIREATNKGYSVAYPGDGVNIGMPNSTTRRGRVNHGLANTLTTASEMCVVDPAIRIRRLTPRECWRLQGFPDEYFDKAKAAGISDSQLYKMAGNAVTVNVARAIGLKLKEIEDEET